MRNDCGDKGRTQNLARGPEAADSKPQQYSSSQGQGRFHAGNGAQVMGTSYTNANLKAPGIAAEQGYTAKKFRQEGPPPIANRMGHFQANASAASTMNAAQQLAHSRGIAQHGPPSGGRFHAKNSQRASALQANIDTSISSRDLSRVAIHQDNSTNYQANTPGHTGQGQRRTMPKAMYQKGVIIRAIHFEEDFERGSGKSFRGPSAAADMAKTLTRTVTGEWLYSKYRKFIVVGLLTERYVAVPLYTRTYTLPSYLIL